MKVYIKKVKRCSECGHRSLMADRASWCCTAKNGRAIPVNLMHHDPMPLPRWCPLPDAEEVEDD